MINQNNYFSNNVAYYLGELLNQTSENLVEKELDKLDLSQLTVEAFSKITASNETIQKRKKLQERFGSKSHLNAKVQKLNDLILKYKKTKSLDEIKISDSKPSPQPSVAKSEIKEQEKFFALRLRKNLLIKISSTELKNLQSEFLSALTQETETELDLTPFLKEATEENLQFVETLLRITDLKAITTFLKKYVEQHDEKTLLNLYQILFKLSPKNISEKFEELFFKKLSIKGSQVIAPLLLEKMDQPTQEFLEKAFIFSARIPFYDATNEEIALFKSYSEKNLNQLSPLSRGVLACCYMYGIGTQKDEKEALEIEKQSEALFKKSKFNFLNMLFLETFLKKQDREAILDSSLKENYPLACYLNFIRQREKIVNLNITPAEKKKLLEKNLYNLKDPIEHGFIPSILEYYLFEDAENLIHIPNNFIHGLENEVSKGSGDAAILLSMIYSAKKYFTTATAWYKKSLQIFIKNAMNDKNPESLYQLALSAYWGIAFGSSFYRMNLISSCSPSDIDLTQSLLKMAAEKGSKNAIFALNYLYTNHIVKESAKEVDRIKNLLTKVGSMPPNFSLSRPTPSRLLHWNA